MVWGVTRGCGSRLETAGTEVIVIASKAFEPSSLEVALETCIAAHAFMSRHFLLPSSA
jgi:hypothetical protein